MSVVHSRKVAFRHERDRAGLGHLNRPRRSEEKISGMQDTNLMCSYKLRAQHNLEVTPTSEKYWNPPSYGLASRLPPSKSAKTARGSVAYGDHVIPFESELEHRILLTLMARTDVADIQGQYPVLRFVDANGKTCKHTADFCVRFTDGYEVAVVVKMERKRADMLLLIERMKAYGTDGAVDDIRFLSEKNGSFEAAANARNVLWSRKWHDQNEIEQVLNLLKKLQGFFRFGDLLWGCGNMSARRVAIWRLIDQGILVSTTGEEITELTWLRKITA
ncbi:hypothetical protein [Pararhizobium sp. DWP3-4]|uniref:hypothetical protein n=1 Tax=Pararhizobium sp. DWP3-4 TaxID=2804565 RepID=UPI003CEDCCFA